MACQAGQEVGSSPRDSCCPLSPVWVVCGLGQVPRDGCPSSRGTDLSLLPQGHGRRSWQGEEANRVGVVPQQVGGRSLALKGTLGPPAPTSASSPGPAARPPAVAPHGQPPALTERDSVAGTQHPGVKGEQRPSHCPVPTRRPWMPLPGSWPGSPPPFPAWTLSLCLPLFPYLGPS